MDHVPETIMQKLSEEEHENLKEIFSSALPKASPKLIDFRFVINLIFARYFFVLLVGKDRYKRRKMNQDTPTSHPYHHSFRRFIHRLTAMLLLLTMNLLVSIFVITFIYMILRLCGFNLSVQLPNA
ncbi:MAG: hypothetical protein DCE90_09130 [Pseudanabaena sp.]|nr:MAG: hypothetical protein DCE90_09130 [Pseudanabaena sp.]